MRRLLASLIYLAAMMLATSAHAQSLTWRVSEVNGDVRLTENGRTRAATRGALLVSGTTVTTSPGARAVIVRGEEFVIVSPRSQLRIPEASQARGGLMQVLADWGTALFRIERRATPHFGVQTPYLAAVVKGTTFTVTVGESGASVQVTEGAVEVSTLDGGAMELVRPGMIVSVTASDLQQLNIEGETTRAVRSEAVTANGSGTETAPTAAYSGPAEEAVTISVAIGEDAVSLHDITNGLIEGTSGVQIAMAEISDAVRSIERAETVLEPEIPTADSGGPTGAGDESGGPPSGGDADDGAGGADPGAPAGGGSAPSSPGGFGDDGNDGNNGHGNDDDGRDPSNPGNGGGNGPGRGDDGDDGNNGHENDDDGRDPGNPGNGGGNGPGRGDDGDDGNNGHGNDDDGRDPGNPGNGGGNGPGRDDDGDDGNNGHGNDDDGSDPGNPGNGGGHGNGRGNDRGDRRGGDD